MADVAGDCLDAHGVEWRQSFLATDGRRMLCWFSAPDAESARLAFRQAGGAAGPLWPGTVHDGPAPAVANVLVERRFPAPVALAAIQAIEDAAAGCLETHRVRSVRTFLARDRRRMICLYQAPDAESVRLAQRQAGMPVERVWAFRPVRPGDAAPDAA